MPGGETDAGEGYSTAMGMVYVFNLIVGTGALTMPAAFSNTGWLLSLIIVVMLCFMSFLTVTFVIEAMAAANAVVHFQALKHLKKVMKEDESESNRMQLMEGILKDEVISNSIDQDEKVPLLLSNSMDSVTETSAAEYYNITERIEMGKMASLFFNKIGVNLFYLCIAIYLYGDLAIYAATVSKSLKDVTCNYIPENQTCYTNVDDTCPCWKNSTITRENAYRIYLSVFVCLLGPFTFFNVQKTKYLQMFTTLMRWLAFGFMIIFAAVALVKGKGKGNPNIADISGTPNLFGVCVYSFMCHHSLPSLITPIKNKSRLQWLLVADYLLILCFYSLLSFTGIFTFRYLEDVYTLNFEVQKCNTSKIDPDDVVIDIPFIQYFLTLFPVFTLSTNFPIIAITLRNNLKSLFLKESKQYNAFVKHILFPVITFIPPVIIAFATEDIEILVGITGSYAGAGIQYVMPAMLVYYARKDTLTILGLGGIKNKHASPFRHTAWLVFVIIWTVTSICFVTVNHIIHKS